MSIKRITFSEFYNTLEDLSSQIDEDLVLTGINDVEQNKNLDKFFTDDWNKIYKSFYIDSVISSTRQRDILLQLYYYHTEKSKFKIDRNYKEDQKLISNRIINLTSNEVENEKEFDYFITKKHKFDKVNITVENLDGLNLDEIERCIEKLETKEIAKENEIQFVIECSSTDKFISNYCSNFKIDYLKLEELLYSLLNSKSSKRCLNFKFKLLAKPAFINENEAKMDILDSYRFISDLLYKYSNDKTFNYEIEICPTSCKYFHRNSYLFHVDPILTFLNQNGDYLLDNSLFDKDNFPMYRPISLWTLLDVFVYFFLNKRDNLLATNKYYDKCKFKIHEWSGSLFIPNVSSFNYCSVHPYDVLVRNLLKEINNWDQDIEDITDREEKVKEREFRIQKKLSAINNLLAFEFERVNLRPNYSSYDLYSKIESIKHSSIEALHKHYYDINDTEYNESDHIITLKNIATYFNKVGINPYYDPIFVKTLSNLVELRKIYKNVIDEAEELVNKGHQKFKCNLYVENYKFKLGKREIYFSNSAFCFKNISPERVSCDFYIPFSSVIENDESKFLSWEVESLSSSSSFERKYIIDGKQLPALTKQILKNADCKYTEQAYISISNHEEVRIRKQKKLTGNNQFRYSLTYKDMGEDLRAEKGILISHENYEELLQTVKGKIIAKDRFTNTDNTRITKEKEILSLLQNATLDVDVYKRDLYGLIVAEIKFKKEENALKFDEYKSSISFLGADITNDKFYKNHSLATNGHPGINKNFRTRYDDWKIIISNKTSGNEIINESKKQGNNYKLLKESYPILYEYQRIDATLMRMLLNANLVLFDLSTVDLNMLIFLSIRMSSEKILLLSSFSKVNNVQKHLISSLVNRNSDFGKTLRDNRYLGNDSLLSFNSSPSLFLKKASNFKVAIEKNLSNQIKQYSTYDRFIAFSEFARKKMIIDDDTLSAIERNADEIWVISTSLENDVHEGPIKKAVLDNIKAGKKYTYFLPSKNFGHSQDPKLRRNLSVNFNKFKKEILDAAVNYKSNNSIVEIPKVYFLPKYINYGFDEIIIYFKEHKLNFGCTYVQFDEENNEPELLRLDSIVLEEVQRYLNKFRIRIEVKDSNIDDCFNLNIKLPKKWPLSCKFFIRELGKETEIKCTNFLNSEIHFSNLKKYDVSSNKEYDLFFIYENEEVLIKNNISFSGFNAGSDIENLKSISI